MNLQKYTYKSSKSKYNAQLNLADRHSSYCDDDTLRFHHARINYAKPAGDGWLFTILESVSVDMHNTEREHRYVIFDVAGNVVNKPSLGDGFRTSAQAHKALVRELDSIDAEAITHAAIQRSGDVAAYEVAEAMKQILGTA